MIDHEPERFAPALAADGVDEVLLVRDAAGALRGPRRAAGAARQLIEAEQPGARAARPHDRLARLRARRSRRRRARLRERRDRAVVGRTGRSRGRGAYGDKLVAELEFPGKDCTLLMVRPGIFEPAAAGGRPALRAGGRARDLDGVARDRARRVSRRCQVGDVDITKASSCSRSAAESRTRTTSRASRRLAERLGATLSVSRPIVDAGWMPSARQVGQSGKTVKPRVYLALGISGAVQHLAGMRTAETIIAVNTDPEAPIFGVAHYGAVADLFEVADELERALD